MPKQKKENAGKNIGYLFNSVKRSNWCALSLPDRDESEEAETVLKECNGWTFSKSNDRKNLPVTESRSFTDLKQDEHKMYPDMSYDNCWKQNTKTTIWKEWVQWLGCSGKNFKGTCIKWEPASRKKEWKPGHYRFPMLQENDFQGKMKPKQRHFQANKMDEIHQQQTCSKDNGKECSSLRRKHNLEVWR